MDLLQREGKYPLPPQASKDILGVEFSGTIEDAGQQSEGAEQEAGKASVDRWSKGDEVFGLAYGVSHPSARPEVGGGGWRRRRRCELTRDDLFCPCDLTGRLRGVHCGERQDDHA